MNYILWQGYFVNTSIDKSVTLVTHFDITSKTAQAQASRQSRETLNATFLGHPILASSVVKFCLQEPGLQHFHSEDLWLRQ